MNCILLMFDSLNRRFLPSYGNNWVHAPSFTRLAERATRFTNACIGSMPCMPARRELHCGRPVLLHNNWGPLEPFDVSMPELLRNAGFLSHMVSDHYHYWEEQAATYHTRYTSWEFFRGQEGDPWIGQRAEPDIPEHRNGKGRRQDWVNRQHMLHEDQLSTPQTVRAGVEFLRRNARHEGWFLQIECFDPHEPWIVPRRYRDLYPDTYTGPLFDWPGYREVLPEEGPDLVEHARRLYAACLSMCDAQLGELLDEMDRQKLWDSTMLIVCTDHGFMLGEKGCWAKNWQPWYQELANTPLFVWDPRFPQAAGQTRSGLVQMIDFAPTILEAFGQPVPSTMIGQSIAPMLAEDAPGREAGLFGIYGGQVNLIDGHHVYMRGGVREDAGPLYEYTLLPVNLHLRPSEQISLHPPFSFTRGMPVLKVPGGPRKGLLRFGTLLYDLQADPQQQNPLHDPALESRMKDRLIALMQQAEAPDEQFERLGL